MRDDIGQLLWIGFAGAVSSAVRGALDRGEAGATIVFKRNLPLAPGPDGERCDLDALVALTGELHRSAPDGTPVAGAAASRVARRRG